MRGEPLSSRPVGGAAAADRCRWCGWRSPEILTPEEVRAQLGALRTEPDRAMAHAMVLPSRPTSTSVDLDLCGERARVKGVGRDLGDCHE